MALGRYLHGLRSLHFTLFVLIAEEPALRRRSSRPLTLAEREEISRGFASYRSLRAIALQLGRSPSTISREANRNGALTHYRASQANQACTA